MGHFKINKLIYTLFLIAAPALSVPSDLYWNECFDKGGVRIFLDSCECVNGKRFHPRKVAPEFMCPGVGSPLYNIMISEGQVSHEGLSAPNVGRKFNYDTFALNRECTNLLEAECYNRESNSCVCGNGYPISLTEFWPNTRNCHGKFVSYGAKPKFSETMYHQDFSSSEGDFAGLLNIARGQYCRFESSNDSELVECVVNDFEPNYVLIIVDYRHLNLQNRPACFFNTIGIDGPELYIKFIGRTHLLIESRQTLPSPPTELECPIGRSRNLSVKDNLPVHFDISIQCILNE